VCGEQVDTQPYTYVLQRNARARAGGLHGHEARGRGEIERRVGRVHTKQRCRVSQHSGLENIHRRHSGAVRARARAVNRLQMHFARGARAQAYVYIRAERSCRSTAGSTYRTRGSSHKGADRHWQSLMCL